MHRFELTDAHSIGGPIRRALYVYDGCRPAERGGLTKGTRVGILVDDDDTTLFTAWAALVKQHGGVDGACAALRGA